MDECGKKVEGPSTCKQTAGPARARLELSMQDLEAILEHAKAGALGEGELATLKAAIQTLEFLTRELEKKSVSIQRLKQLLFGAATETTAKLMQKVLERAAGSP